MAETEPTSRTRTELARTTADDVHRAAGLLTEFDRRSVARRLGLPPTALTTDPTTTSSTSSTTSPRAGSR